MRLQFLGTGAADWDGPDARGEYRRLTATRIDDSLLIDLTATTLGEIERPESVTDVLFTHSHADHFDPGALRALSPRRVYAHESWAKAIDLPGAEVISVKAGEAFGVPGGYRVTALPANHSTERADEQPLHYLIEKDGKALLYATDGAWMLNRARHILGDRTLDAAVFDATIGDGFDGDWRVFEHNSIDMVRLMTATLLRTGTLAPGAPVFLTHMARTLHKTQAEIEARLAPPLIACFDGMTAEV